MTSSWTAAASVALVIAMMPLGAQPVLLQIRPRVGDTLSVWMNQKVEMTGMPPDCAASPAGSKGNTARSSRSQLCSDQTRTMTSVMEVFSRAIVRRSRPGGTTVFAVTDSIRTSTSSGRAKPATPSRVRGRDNTFELMVSPDGGAEVLNADASEELRAVFGEMPATLSRRPVEVGEKWTRQMRLPIAGKRGTFGLVRATFQLDSLGRNERMAYISMCGTITHDQGDGADPDLSGSMAGTIQLDRRLAWITETRAVIDATSVVEPAGGGRPIHVHTKITQLVRAGSRR